jgi:WD40 repeat protein
VFSPNNQLVASGSNDCTMRVWDITTGVELHTMNGHESLVRAVAFSPDGQYIVSASGHSIRIWDASTGTQRHLINHESVTCVAFSPSGQHIISGSHDGTILEWNVSMGTQQHLVSTAANRGHQGYVQSVAFSPNAQHIAACSYIRGTVQVWDITTGTRQHCRTDEGKSWVKSVAFSPDGQRIACGFNNTIHVLDVEMGTKQHVLHGHEDDVCSVAFSPDGRHIVSASKDSTVRVWDIKTDAQHHPTSGPSCGITSLKFWSDGRYVVSGSIGDVVQAWDTTTGMLLLFSHNKLSPRSVAFSPNGQLVAFEHHDHTVRVWNGTQQLVMHLPATAPLASQMYWRKSTVCCIAFSLNSQLVASAHASDSQFAIRVWDTATGTQQIALNGHRRLVNSVAFSPDGYSIVSTSDDYTVRVWDVRTGTQQHCLTGHRDRVLSAVFSPDGHYIASGSRDHTLRVWDSSTGAQRHIMTHDDRVNFVAFTPSGQHIVSGHYSRRHIRVWDTTTGTLDQSMIGHEGAVYSVAFSHDGQYVTAICSKSIIRDSDEHFRYTNSSPHVGVGLVWDASTGASITTYGLGDDRRVASALTQHPTTVYSLDIETGWISRTNFQGVPKRLCWLPKERRGRQIVAWGQKICIGATSGMVTILDFSNVESP